MTRIAVPLPLLAAIAVCQLPQDSSGQSGTPPTSNSSRNTQPDDRVENRLILQRAMADARHLLERNQPIEAVKTLEAVLSLANGDAAYLDLLRRAYQAELAQWERAGGMDQRIDRLRRYIDLLQQSASVSGSSSKAFPMPMLAPGPMTSGDTPSTPPSPETPSVAQPVFPPSRNDSSSDKLLAEAVTLFQQKRYDEAARRFAQLRQLSPEHQAAWAYCRIRLAVEQLHRPDATAATLDAALAELQAAAQLLPSHSELRHYAEQALRTARQRLDSARQTLGPAEHSGGKQRFLETASFRISGDLAADRLAVIGRLAEQYRQETFERWSGPASAPWQPKCELVLHSQPTEFSQAAGVSPEYGAVSRVALEEGRVTARRLDILTADEIDLSSLLRRELTHVVLADLFTQTPPPRWAAIGISARMAGSSEVDRYRRTLLKEWQAGRNLPLSQFVELRDCPPSQVTLYCCISVCLVDFLVQKGGSEKNFTLFLRDTQRYGLAAALKRQYGYDSPAALETAWKDWLTSGVLLP